MVVVLAVGEVLASLGELRAAATAAEAAFTAKKYLEGARQLRTVVAEASKVRAMVREDPAHDAPQLDLTTLGLPDDEADSDDLETEDSGE